MIRVTIRGQEETQKRLSRIGIRLRTALFKGLQDVAIQIWSKAKVNAPVFRGLLRESILWNVQVEEGRIVGRVGSALVYAPVVEFGREKGWFPNVSELRTWARRKIGAETVEVGGKRWNLPFIIGRAIQRRGFRKQPYLTPASREVAPRIKQIIEQRVTQALQAEGGKP